MTPLENMDELRRIILSRRAPDAASNGSRFDFERAGVNPASASLETSREQLDRCHNVFDMDLTSPVPWVGRPLTLLKRLIRRMLRSYIDRQTAFNQHCLALFVSANDEQSRRESVFRMRMERLEDRVFELEDIVNSLSIELSSRRAEAAEAVGLDRPEKMNPSR
ncbi:MAG: hypothetical protein ACRD21_27415 [Vicinamibacteria bacterium]